MTHGFGRRMRMCARVAIVAAAASVALGSMATRASASITTPTNGSDVRGVVQIQENDGGDNHAICGSGNTAIQLFHPNGTSIMRWEKGSGGALSVKWDSFGSGNLANYRIISQKRDRSISFSGCRLSAWSTISDIRVHLDNRSSVAFTSLPSSGSWGTSVPVHARLVDPNNGNRAIPGRTLTFSLDGQPGGLSTTTDSNGTAAVLFPVNRAPGSTTFRVRFDEDCCWRASSTSLPFSVSKRPTSVSYNGQVSAYALESVPVGARLTDTISGQAVASKNITFGLYSGGTLMRSASASTDGGGDAATTLPTDVPAGSYSIRASFAEDSHYTASAMQPPASVLSRPTTTTYVGEGSGYWDESVTLRAQVLDVRSSTPLSGGAVRFDLGSHTTSTSTGIDGVASTAAPLVQLPSTYPLNAAFLGDAFRATSNDAGSFEILRRPTAIDYRGDTSGYWDEDASLSAVLSDVRSGEVLWYRPLTYTIGDEVSSGQSSETATMRLTQVPGAFSLSSRFEQDTTHLASDSSTPFEVLRRPTVIDYTGATSGQRGHEVTLSATLTDERAGYPLDGRTLDFDLGSHNTTAGTDADGHAEVSVLLEQAPGTYTASASWDGDAYRVPAADAENFLLDWEFTFADDLGSGRVFLNPTTKEFQFEAPGDSSEIKHDPGMGIYATPARVTPPDAPCDAGDPGSCVPALPETPDLPDLPDLPDVPEVPEVPSCVEDPTGGDPFCADDYLPQQRSSEQICVEDVPGAEEPVCTPDAPPPPCDPTDPPSCGELPDLPDVPEVPEAPEPGQACHHIPSAEGCRRHIVTIAFADDDIALAGWFDLRTGAFSAAVRTTIGAYALGSSGSPCTVDPNGCVPQVPDPPCDPAAPEGCVPELPELPEVPEPPCASDPHGCIPTPPSCVEDPVTGEPACLPE